MTKFPQKGNLTLLLMHGRTDPDIDMISVDALPKGVANKIKRAIGAPKKAETKSLDTQQGV